MEYLGFIHACFWCYLPLEFSRVLLGPWTAFEHFTLCPKLWHFQSLILSFSKKKKKNPNIFWFLKVEAFQQIPSCFVKMNCPQPPWVSTANIEQEPWQWWGYVLASKRRQGAPLIQRKQGLGPQQWGEGRLDGCRRWSTWSSLVPMPRLIANL